jgi:hypothetical protein
LVVVALAEEDGAPIQGVTVLLGPEPPDKDLRPISGPDGNRLITDASGRAKAGVPAERRIRLSVRGDAAPPGFHSVDPLAEGETREVELRLATRSDLRFVARVIADEGGAPLPDAWATVGDIDLLFPQPLELMALLAKGRRGARAGACAPDPTRVEVDGDGYFEVDVRSWQDAVARVEAPRHSMVLVPFERGHETRDTALEVRLARSAALDVLALDAARNPLQDVRIRLSARAYTVMPFEQAVLWLPSSMEQATWESHTGPDGRTRIEGLPSGAAFTLHAQPQRGRVQILPDELVLQPGEVRPLEIVIRSDGAIAGSLRKPDGSPVSEAEIWLKTRGELRYVQFDTHERNEVRKTRTDEQGRFQFDGVTDGEWIVGAAPLETRAPNAVEVLVQDGSADEVLLTAWDDLFIRGTVLDPTGTPCQATVVTRLDDSRGPVQAKSDAEGSFALGPLAAGTYELIATAGYKSDNLWADSDPLPAEAGASGVTLTLRSGSALSGRVVDAATGKGVQVLVMLSQHGCESRQGSSSRKDGGFQFGGLEPGVYALTATTPGGSCAVLGGVRLAAGQRNDALELAVRPGGRLRVHYDGDAPSATIQIEHDGVCVDWDSVSRGKPRDWIVPEGTNQVRCTEDTEAAARASTQEVAVPAGGVTELRFGG